MQTYLMLNIQGLPLCARVRILFADCFIPYVILLLTNIKRILVGVKRMKKTFNCDNFIMFIRAISRLVVIDVYLCIKPIR